MSPLHFPGAESKRRHRQPRHSNSRDTFLALDEAAGNKSFNRKTPTEHAHEISDIVQEEQIEEVIQEEEENVTEQPLAVGPFLSETESSDVLKMSVNEIVSLFQEKCKLDADTNVKDAVILDYYVDAAVWAQQQMFNQHQLCMFLEFMHSVMQNFMDGKSSLVDMIDELHNTVTKIARGCKENSRPPKIFSSEQGKVIFDYCSLSYLQHLKLYEYMFSKLQPQELVAQELSVEVPLSANLPFLPPLEEGMVETVFDECFDLTSPPFTEEAEEDFVIVSEEIELPRNLSETFAKLTHSDVKRIINSVTSSVLNELQVNVETKIKSQQATSLAKINKVHTILPKVDPEK